MAYPKYNYIDFKFLNQNWSCHVDDIDIAIKDLKKIIKLLKVKSKEYKK